MRTKILLDALNTVMHGLMMGLHSGKCTIRQFPHCANIIEHTFTNLDGIAYYRPRLYGTPIAPRLQTGIAYYCTEYRRKW